MEAANAVARDVSASPLAAAITAQIDTKLVSLEDVNFHFRKDKEVEEKNKENKNVVGKTKRATFKAPLPLLTKAGVIAALSADDKATLLIIEKANEAIIDRFRGMVTDAIENDTFNTETGKWSKELDIKDFDMNQLNFLTIANLPKSERGAGIPKEVWAAFVADYIETMQKPEATALFSDKKQRTPEVLAKHGQILGGKFNQVRSRKDVIGQMLGFLDIWVVASDNAEEFQACYEHLTAKGKVLMAGETFEDL